MSGGPGGTLPSWSPTPPQKGSFPMDHDHECSEQMVKYLNCIKLTEGRNAPNCRLLAKSYLKCRMDHELMDTVPWDELGLPDDQTTKKQ